MKTLLPCAPVCSFRFVIISPNCVTVLRIPLPSLINFTITFLHITFSVFLSLPPCLPWPALLCPGSSLSNPTVHWCSSTRLLRTFEASLPGLDGSWIYTQKVFFKITRVSPVKPFRSLLLTLNAFQLLLDVRFTFSAIRGQFCCTSFVIINKQLF